MVTPNFPHNVPRRATIELIVPVLVNLGVSSLPVCARLRRADTPQKNKIYMLTVCLVNGKAKLSIMFENTHRFWITIVKSLWRKGTRKEMQVL